MTAERDLSDEEQSRLRAWQAPLQFGRTEIIRGWSFKLIYPVSILSLRLSNECAGFSTWVLILFRLQLISSVIRS